MTTAFLDPRPVSHQHYRFLDCFILLITWFNFNLNYLTISWVLGSKDSIAACEDFNAQTKSKQGVKEESAFEEHIWRSSFSEKLITAKACVRGRQGWWLYKYAWKESFNEEFYSFYSLFQMPTAGRVGFFHRGPLLLVLLLFIGLGDMWSKLDPHRSLSRTNWIHTKISSFLSDGSEHTALQPASKFTLSLPRLSLDSTAPCMNFQNITFSNALQWWPLCAKDL